MNEKKRQDFYVYVLFREPEPPHNGTPFYVGKGKGRRVDRSAEGQGGRNLRKQRIIRRINKKGQKVFTLKIAENLEEWEAFEIEIETIALIGRHPKGPLTNLTDGGEGNTGWKKSPAQIEVNREHLKNLWLNPNYRTERIVAMRKWWNDHPEHRESARLKSTGRKKSPETCAAQSQHMKNLWLDQNYRCRAVESLKISKQKPEARKAQSVRAIKMMSDPKMREKFAIRVKLHWSDPHKREKTRVAMSAAKSTPEQKAAQANRNYEMWSDPERRKNLSLFNTIRWSDPAFKEKTSAAISAAKSTLEARAAQSARNSHRWSNPDLLERQKIKNKETWSNPDLRESLAQRKKAQWADPEFREKMLLAQRLAAKKRAEKG